MRRCTEHTICAIDFQSGCSTTDQPKIANHFVYAYALEDKSCTSMKTIGQAGIWRRNIETLSSKAGADDHLGGPSLASPQSTIFTSEAVVILARFCRPGANAT